MVKDRRAALAVSLSWALTCLALFIGACAHLPSDGGTPSPDAAWSPYPVSEKWLSEDEIAASSFYLTMRDGVKIAVDLYLPKDLKPGEKLPAILHLTRYYRSWALRWPYNGRRVNRLRKRFLANGYAWLDVDARGSGASFGVRSGPTSPAEIADYAEVVDWIIGQPWSSGRVGATGTSYEGQAAERLLARAHPAVRAVIPQFSAFDLYADIAFPGGIRHSWFIEKWGQFNFFLDSHTPHKRFKSLRFRLLVKGVRPVDEDPDGEVLARAAASHAHNYSPGEVTRQMIFRDDLNAYDPTLSFEAFSPHGYIREMHFAATPAYGYSGWLDGGNAHAAIKRFLTVRTPGSRLVLGPWNHGGSSNSSPWVQAKSRFDHAGEMLRFFDAHLKDMDTGIRQEPPVHYYTMGEEKWKAADTWPPPGTRTLTYYLAPEGALSPRPPPQPQAWDEYRADYRAGTGRDSRWDTLLHNHRVSYPDRAERDRILLTYTSDPLEADLEVTGHPVVRLYVASTASDGHFFVYLEDVDEKGRVRYVTEGMLRALHRRLSDEAPPYVSPAPYRSFKRRDARPLAAGEAAELVFDLLPTSYLFKKGHALRIAIAGADRDHFEPRPDPPPTLKFYRQRGRASAVELPVMAGN